jgi:protein-S-isoprenylcysteine O-methyltransferase Ste14
VQKTKQLALVIIQFTCIALLVLTGPVITDAIGLQLLQVAAFVIGGLAIINMNASRLSVLPAPLPGARLITNGIYKYIRHPMYNGVLLMCGSWLLNYVSLFRVIIFFILLTDIIIKIATEEKLLQINFAEYAWYKKKTWRLIPFVF